MTVGGASTKATVKISSGGDLEIATDLTVGEEAGSKGTLSVTDAGSQVSVGGDATLGEAGSGTLTMTGGAMSVAGAMTLGEEEGFVWQIDTQRRDDVDHRRFEYRRSGLRRGDRAIGIGPAVESN